MELFFLFLVGHAVCDFVLQSPAMCKGKSRRRQRAEAQEPGFPAWHFWLSAHALTHGGAVYLASGSWGLGALESVLHAAIDHTKCEGRINLNQDQTLHLACKIGYVFLLM